MIVSWTEDGVIHTGDDQGKAYKRHLAAKASKPAAEFAEGGPVVETPEVESQPPAVEQPAEVADAAGDRPRRTR